MFDQEKIAKEIYELHKTYWETTTALMSAWQKQNERMWNMMLDQGLLSHQEGRKTLQEWLNGVKQTQEQYNKLVEESWSKAASTFGGSPKTGK